MPSTVLTAASSYLMCQDILFKARESFKTANNRYFEYFKTIPLLMKADLIHSGPLTVNSSEQNCGNLVKGSNDDGILYLVIKEGEILVEEGGSCLSVSITKL
jgi:hypothetical protein